MRYFGLPALLMVLFFLAGCVPQSSNPTSSEAKNVSAQQDQYLVGQPIPAFDWSLERDLLIQLYDIRNKRVATHSVWRSNYGVIEGDCASIGYGLPYDTSLTNPLKATDYDEDGEEHSYQGGALATIEQAEPNGIYASKNTAATWVFCVGEGGALNPVYVETKVTVYPYPLSVDYDNDRVAKAGSATVNFSVRE